MLTTVGSWTRRLPLPSRRISFVSVTKLMLAIGRLYRRGSDVDVGPGYDAHSPTG